MTYRSKEFRERQEKLLEELRKPLDTEKIKETISRMYKPQPPKQKKPKGKRWKLFNKHPDNFKKF